VARELFLDRGARPKTESAKVGNAKYRSSLELERFLSRKEAFSKKKKRKKKGLPWIWAYFYPKNGSKYKSQGGQKSPRGGQNISISKSLM